jgi:hypothetical protein
MWITFFRNVTAVRGFARTEIVFAPGNLKLIHAPPLHYLLDTPRY